MTSAFYAIPPDLPVVWTDPSSIQVGVSPPLATVTGIPNDATPLIHALIDGISESGLAVLATQHGVSPLWVRTLLDDLAPVFGHYSRAPQPSPWQVWSSSPASADLVRLGEGLGLDLAPCDSPLENSGSPGPTLVLADYVLHPHWVNTLTRGSHPHLPVVFSDQEVRVGPIITPGVTPCLVCLESHSRDNTPSWLEIGSQLWQRESPLHTPSAHGTVIALIVGFVTRSLGWEEGNTSRQAVFRPGEGVTTWRDMWFHPECACRGVPARRN